MFTKQKLTALLTILIFFFPIIVFGQDTTFWWHKEYGDLLKLLSEQNTKSLETSYETGSNRENVVKIRLEQLENSFVLLTVEKPASSVVSYDRKTGRIAPVVDNPMVVFKDHDSNGMPDHCLLTSKNEYKPRQSTNNFFELGPYDINNPLFTEWAVCIGFCVNKFLHNTNSALPPWL